jgi:hypothetical protein
VNGIATRNGKAAENEIARAANRKRELKRVERVGRLKRRGRAGKIKTAGQCGDRISGRIRI